MYIMDTKCVDGQRLEFNAAYLAYSHQRMREDFTRGYDDARCGRNHAHVSATIAGDAYRKGWALGERHR